MGQFSVEKPGLPGSVLSGNQQRKSPFGAPKGALFRVAFGFARHMKPTAMLAAIKGLSRHKRFPPHAAGECRGSSPKVRQRRARFPRLFHDPLTAAVPGGVRKASGRKGVSLAKLVRRPCGSVEQKGNVRFDIWQIDRSGLLQAGLARFCHASCRACAIAPTLISESVRR
jgi:hypothetical protein